MTGDEKENSIFFNHSFDKKRLKALISWVFKKSGEAEALRVLDLLKEIGFRHATKAGISIGLHDLTTPATKSWLISESQQSMNTAYRDFIGAKITATERSQRIIDTWHRASESLSKQVVDYFGIYDTFNPVYIMALSGARGNFSQVRQLIGMRGLMADQQGKIVNFPIRSNLREGLTITEYFISCSGARKGLVDTALRTADTGYLTRRLVDVSHHVVVKRIRCNTDRGIPFKNLQSYNKILLSLKERLIGRVLAENIVLKNNLVLKKDREISSSLALEITRHRNQVLIRSPLTCGFTHEVCQLCYGWSISQGSLVSLGDAVGVIAAQSIGEPGTQLTMRTFHTGGVFSGDLLQEVRAPHAGRIEFSKAFQGLLIRTGHGRIAFLSKTSGSLILSNSQENNLRTSKGLQTQLQTRRCVAPLVHPFAYKAELCKEVQRGAEICKERGFVTRAQMHIENPEIFKGAGRESFFVKNVSPPSKNKTLANKESDFTIIPIQPFTMLFVRQGEKVEMNQLLAEFSIQRKEGNQPIKTEQILFAELSGKVIEDCSGKTYIKYLKESSLLLDTLRDYMSYWTRHNELIYEQTSFIDLSANDDVTLNAPQRIGTSVLRTKQNFVRAQSSKSTKSFIKNMSLAQLDLQRHERAKYKAELCLQCSSKQKLFTLDQSRYLPTFFAYVARTKQVRCTYKASPNPEGSLRICTSFVRAKTELANHVLYKGKVLLSPRYKAEALFAPKPHSLQTLFALAVAKLCFPYKAPLCKGFAKNVALQSGALHMQKGTRVGCACKPSHILCKAPLCLHLFANRRFARTGFTNRRFVLVCKEVQAKLRFAKNVALLTRTNLPTFFAKRSFACTFLQTEGLHAQARFVKPRSLQSKALPAPSYKAELCTRTNRRFVCKERGFVRTPFVALQSPGLYSNVRMRTKLRFVRHERFAPLQTQFLPTTANKITPYPETFPVINLEAKIFSSNFSKKRKQQFLKTVCNNKVRKPRMQDICKTQLLMSNKSEDLENDLFRYIEPVQSGRLGFLKILSTRIGATFDYTSPIKPKNFDKFLQNSFFSHAFHSNVQSSMHQKYKGESTLEKSDFVPCFTMLLQSEDLYKVSKKAKQFKDESNTCMQFENLRHISRFQFRKQRKTINDKIWTYNCFVNQAKKVLQEQNRLVRGLKEGKSRISTIKYLHPEFVRDHCFSLQTIAEYGDIVDENYKNKVFQEN